MLLFYCRMQSFNNTVMFLFQGPLPNTCGHFWEMVWEQRSRGVVMLNRVIEKGSVSSWCLTCTVAFVCRYSHCLLPLVVLCVSRTRRLNVPNIGLTERRATPSLKTPTSSLLLFQRTLNPTIRSVSWSWKICL